MVIKTKNAQTIRKSEYRNYDKKAVKQISKFVSNEICKQVKKAINETVNKDGTIR